MSRIILHLDFNSYFATCEQQEHPEWRGKPVGVCEHLGGIIIAASVEAKKWGIGTGTPVWEAKKLFPNIILTKTHPDTYRYYTARFLKVLSDYTDRIEKYSIDEAFLDITKACNIQIVTRNSQRTTLADPYVEAEKIAKEIKRRLKIEVGDYLTCSVGIGENKLLAKIASDLKKPNGLVVVRPQDKPWLYRKLKLTDIPGIAKRQERNLNALGIYKLTDLRDYPLTKLVSRFGIMGYHLYRIGQLEGSWKEGFTEIDPQKSIGHVYTIAREFRASGVVEQVLYKLSEMVGLRLRAGNFLGRVVYAHVWDPEQGFIGKGKKLSYALNDGRDIFLEARAVLASVLGKTPHGVAWPAEVRQVGVTVSGLALAQHQLSLFAFDEKKRQLVAAMDKINQKYEAQAESIRQTSKLGDAHEGVTRGWVVARVPAFLARNIIRDSIGFGRMKEFDREAGKRLPKMTQE